MPYNYAQKSSVEEIRERFDQDVERFSKLETGQVATIDAVLSLDLITEAARCVTPAAQKVLDIGCGAGNYTLKLLAKLPGLSATLVDLSQPMLDRARERVREAGAGNIETIQADIRELDLPDAQYDIILAGAVLHHLREDEEWKRVFRKLYRALRSGGSLWISDLIRHDSESIQGLMWQRYGAYLQELGGKEYQEKVFAYIDKEDTPRSLRFQLDMLKEAGFGEVEILHKNSCFAAFGAIKR
jgi:tRNA (cmo5U34)-methyltransferase